MLKLIRRPRRFELHGTVFDALASPAAGSRETAAWFVTLPPGAQGARHAVTREEIFVALEGRARVESADGTWEFAAGEALVVPPGVPFTLGNGGDTPFRAVAVLPVGGQALLPDGRRFVPPWAQ